MLEVHVSVVLENQNLLLNLLRRLTLINLLLKLGHLVLIEENFELSSLGPASDKQVELLNDLAFALDYLIMELRDHLVLHYIIEEGIGNVLLSGLFVLHLLEDLAETIPPSSKLLGRLENVSAHLFQLGSEFIHSWVEGNLWMIVRTRHFYKARSFSSHPDSFVGS